jgi:hypothetical protein
MATLTGGCLCGQIRFEVDGPVAGIGVCHCSLCRKISGNNGVMIFVVPMRRFRWTSGEEHVVAWFLRPGVGTARCDVCGCPTPASHDSDKHMWVQPGLIDGDIDARWPCTSSLRAGPTGTRSRRTPFSTMASPHPKFALPATRFDLALFLARRHRARRRLHRWARNARVATASSPNSGLTKAGVA